MSNVVTNCNCTTEANILAKYGNTFPDSFVECVRQGCTWLASHNNLTYQTSTLVRTDAIVYTNSGSSVLKIGLIDVDRPTTGLTQYDVISVKETKDLINGCTVYTVKAAYKTPMGIELTFIPIKYFDPNKLNPTDYYTVSQVDELLKVVQEQIDLLKAEPVVTKEQLNTALAEYTLSSQHDQDIAVLNKRIDDAEIGEDQEHTTFLTIAKAEEIYTPKTDLAEYAKLTDVDEKIKAEDKSITEIVKANTQNAVKKQNYAQGMFLNTCDYVIYNNNVYSAKLPFMITGTFDNDKKNLFDVTAMQNSTAVTADDVASKLKTDDTFKASIKGEQGDPGESPTAEEVANVLKVDGEFKESVKGQDGQTPDLTDYATKEYVTEEIGKIQPATQDTDAIVTALKADTEFTNAVKGTDGISPSAQDVATEVKDEVVTALTNNDDFKAAVKGDTGPQGPEADTSTLATKDELAEYVKTETLTTELEKKVSVTDFDTYKGTVYTKEEADNQFEPKTTTDS